MGTGWDLPSSSWISMQLILLKALIHRSQVAEEIRLLKNLQKRCSKITLYAVLSLLSNTFLSGNQTILCSIDAVCVRLQGDQWSRSDLLGAAIKLFFWNKESLSLKLLSVHGSWEVTWSIELILLLCCFTRMEAKRIWPSSRNSFLPWYCTILPQCLQNILWWENAMLDRG